MEIKSIAFAKPSVIVLGAGATRGASFVNTLPGTLPPLDSDFFTQAQRLSSAKPSTLVSALVQNVVQVFGTNFNLTMEGFLTHIEYLSNVFEDYRLTGRPKRNPYSPMREQFLQALAAVLDEAIGRLPRCDFHRILVDALAPTDTILSFNYDWLIDETLRTRAHRKWNPRTGYGVDAYINGKRGQGTRYWACYDPRKKKRLYPAATIHLLKMHGSMNWFPVSSDRNPIRLQLRQRWWHQTGSLAFEIAPPEWNKPIRSGIYQRVWQRARVALKSATSLAFIGYSLPPADLPAQALFMVDSREVRGAPKLDLLIIVNPDKDARSRIRSVLSGRIDHSTRVLTFDLFEHFARFLTPTDMALWSSPSALAPPSPHTTKMRGSAQPTSVAKGRLGHRRT